MRKKVLILFLLCFTFVSATVSAETFYNYFPGGKNYLYEGNFTSVGESIHTIDMILVKPSTTYTISIPGTTLIDRAMIGIEDEFGYVYLDDEIEAMSGCTTSSDYSSCTFTTNSTSNYLSISVTGYGISQYFGAYQLLDFQLEEGSSRTVYEEYVIPLVDTESPEFNGSGAFIMSYTDNLTISQIIEEHIVVIDEIDGDLKSSIEIVSDDYTVNMGTVGEYIVELKATDSSNNSAYFNLVIVVKDEILPEITGPDSININVDENLTIETIVADNYTVLDGYDSTLTINVVYDEYSASFDTLGSYTVTLHSIDSSGNEITKDVTLNVVDTTMPTLVSSSEITVNLSDPKTIDVILDDMILSDNYDLSSSISKTIIADGYTENSMIIGNYSVNVLITDLSGNQNSIDLAIAVVDDVFPVIEGPSTYSFSYTNPHTLEDILSILLVSDNYSSLSVSDLVVTTDNYSNRTTEIGTYSISVEVSDSSGNKVTHDLLVTVVDDQAPSIYIDDYIVTLSGNVSFTLEDALSIMVHNKELPNMNYNAFLLEDEYTGNEEVPGSYLYKVLFTNEAGEKVVKDFMIEVPNETEDNALNIDLIIRNVIVYALTFTMFGFVIIKNKK